jgi:hypothetical protein
VNGDVVTFIVRIARDAAGTRRGTVERVRTGEKAPFSTTAGIGRVIDRMLGGETPTRRRRGRPQEDR